MNIKLICATGGSGGIYRHFDIGNFFVFCSVEIHAEKIWIFAKKKRSI